MVTPISGPKSVTEYLLFPPPMASFKKYYRQRIWYVQKKPYNLRLSFVSGQAFIEQTNVQEGYDCYIDPEVLSHVDSAVASSGMVKAYGKFMTQVKETANLVVNLAEYRQSAGMMISRASQLLRFARAMNRLDFYTAAQQLKLDPKPTSKRLKDRWHKDRSIANCWLEVHFGWVPLMGDINSSIGILTEDFPNKNVKVRGRGDPQQIDGVPFGGFMKMSYRSEGGVQYAGTVRVTNPNLFQASQLGLTNPLIVAWELIPFSFVVDWFANVSQVLGQFDDMFGITLDNAATTTASRNSRTVWSLPPTTPGFRAVGTGGGCVRSMGISLPGFHLYPIKGPSLTRAATAISLLVQALPRH